MHFYWDTQQLKSLSPNAKSRVPNLTTAQNLFSELLLPVSYLSIWIDSKSIILDSSVVFTVYLDWLDLSLTSLLINNVFIE